MDFWRTALQAAEKAATAAKDLGKKGLEVVEATAEEANKKLNLNLHEKVGAGPPKNAPPSLHELEEFGVTPTFEEFVRTLNYSVFRDFPPEHLLPARSSSAAATDGGTVSSSSDGGGEGGSVAAAAPYQLNKWQVRHATLVVQALKEVNELRFVLCPKYMTDEHFWHVYFTLSRKYLPEQAYSWGPDDELPGAAGEASSGLDAFSFTGLGNQLMQLGSKLQSATSAQVSRGFELTSFKVGGSSFGGGFGSGGGSSFGGGGGSSDPQPMAAPNSSAAVGGAAAAAPTVASSPPPPVSKPAPSSGMLAEDPDLEAYLQVAISTSQPGSQAGEEDGSGYAVGEDDLDLDSYINELSAEVEAVGAEGEEGAGDAAGSEDDGKAD